MPYLMETLQVVFWHSNAALGDKLRVASALQEICEPVREGDPVIFPARHERIEILDDAPLLSLRSESSEWVLNVAGTRVDFFRQYKTGSRPDVAEAIGPLLGHVDHIAQYFQQQLGAVVPRVALVVKVVLDLPEAVQSTIDRFLDEPGIFEDAKKIEFHTHHVLTIGGFDLNRWIRLKTIHKRDDPTQTGMLIEVDLNTVAREGVQLSLDQIHEFCTVTAEHALDMLPRALPDAAD